MSSRVANTSASLTNVGNDLGLAENGQVAGSSSLPDDILQVLKATLLKVGFSRPGLPPVTPGWLYPRPPVWR
jgi:hypothetical protein